MAYPNSGVLWSTNEKRHEKAPDMFGEIKIEKDLLMSLMEEAQGSSEVTIKINGWLGKDRNERRMVSIKIDTYKRAAPAQSQDNGKDPWDD